MPKVTAATLAVTALIVLGLTGCAGTPESAGDERTAPKPTESAAPLVAETGTPDVTEVEAAFVETVRENLPSKTSIANASDEQLLAAGEEACSRLAAGEPSEQIVLIEGEQPWENGTYYDSATIITSARIHLCPA